MKKRTLLSEWIIRVITICGLFLLMNGTASMLSATFEAPIKQQRAVIVFLAAAVFWTVVFMSGHRRLKVSGHVAGLGAFALYVILQHQTLMNSALFFADRINQRYYAYTGNNLIDSHSRLGTGQADAVLLFGCVLLGYLAALMMFQLSWEALAYTPVYVAVSGCLCCGRTPSKGTIIQLIIGMTVVLLCKMFCVRSGRVTMLRENLRERLWGVVRHTIRRSSDKRRGFAEDIRHIKMVRMRWRQRMPANIIPALCAACVLLAISICSGAVITKNIEADVMKYSPKFQRKELQMERALIAKIQQMAQYARSKTGVGAEGVMTNSRPQYTGKKIMTVTLDFEPKSDLYFRGFTGETYKDGVWSAGDDTEFEEKFAGLRNYLWKQNYSVIAAQVPYSSSLQSMIQNGEITVEYNGMSMLTGKAFLPYFADLQAGDGDSSDAVVKLIGDKEIKRAKKMYTTDYYLMSETAQRALITTMDMSDIYNDDDDYTYDEAWDESGGIGKSVEQQYLDYASLHYGSYNAPNLKKYRNLVRRRFKGYYSANTAGDLLWAVNGVSELLAENTSYSLNLDSVPAGQDYAEYFLFEQKKGYCEHYATAATILLRDLGVPARYVSGYRLSKKSFHKRKDGKYTATVIDSDAHAWTETYGEYYGWMPWDMTPASSDAEEERQTEATAAPTDAQSATPEPTATAAAVTQEPVDMPEETIEPTPIPTSKQKTGLSGKKNAKNRHKKQSLTIHLTAAQVVWLVLVLIVIGVILYFRLRQEQRKRAIVAASSQRGKIAVGRSISYLMDALWLSGNAVPKGSGEQGLQTVLETTLQGAASAEKRQWYWETIWRSGYSPEAISPEEQQQFWKQTNEYVRAIRSSAGKLRKVLFFFVFPR